MKQPLELEQLFVLGKTLLAASASCWFFYEVVPNSKHGIFGQLYEFVGGEPRKITRTNETAPSSCEKFVQAEEFQNKNDNNKNYDKNIRNAKDKHLNGYVALPWDTSLLGYRYETWEI